VKYWYSENFVDHHYHAEVFFWPAMTLQILLMTITTRKFFVFFCCHRSSIFIDDHYEPEVCFCLAAIALKILSMMNSSVAGEHSSKFRVVMVSQNFRCAGIMLYFIDGRLWWVPHGGKGPKNCKTIGWACPRPRIALCFGNVSVFYHQDSKEVIISRPGSKSQ